MVWQRKKAFIQKKEQIYFACEVLLNCLTIVLVLAFLLFVPPMKLWLGVEESVTDELFQLLSNVLLKKYLWVGVALFVGVLISILQSHRLYGPMVAIHKIMDKRLSGNTAARLKLRKYDYLTPIEEPINQLMDHEDAFAGSVLSQVKSIQSKLLQSELNEVSKKLSDLEKMLQTKMSG